MKKVRIKVLPKAGGGVEVNNKLFNGNQTGFPTKFGEFSEEGPEVRKQLNGVPVEDANLEAEKGETMIMNQGGIPAQFKIGGKPHSQGGTPLQAPDGSFVFSKTKEMKIKDPTILAQFGVTAKSAVPADIAKKYDVNNYRKTLGDKNSSDLDKKTAEMMISNYNLKLAKLGLVQESMKGFPQGIPAISMPYIETMGINPAEFAATQGQQEQVNPDMNAKFGGGLPKAQWGKQQPTWQEISTGQPSYSRRPMSDGSKNNPFELPEVEVVGKSKKKVAGFSSLDVSQPRMSSKEKEARFAANPDTKDAYATYYKALHSGKASDMMAAADALDAFDVPNSVGWLPWTDQDKVQDLAGILREKAATVGKKTISAAEQTAQYAKKAKDAYDIVSYQMNKFPEGSIERLQKQGELNEIAKYHPVYKHNSPYIPGELTGTEPIVYSNNEINAINSIANKYPESLVQIIKKNTKAKVPSEKEKIIVKEQATVPVTNTPTTATTPTAIASEQIDWNFKYGGSLDRYDTAGQTPKKKSYRSKVMVVNGNSITAYQDDKGNKWAVNSKGEVIVGTIPKDYEADFVAKKSSTSPSNNPSIDTYTDPTQAMIKAKQAEGFDVDLTQTQPGGTPKEKRDRLANQHLRKGQKNVFGDIEWNDKTKADLQRRQPWIFKKYPDWDPNNTEQVKWAQDEYDKMYPGYYDQKDAKGNYIQGTSKNGKFGEHTFSMPAFNKKAAVATNTETVATEGDKAAAAAAGTGMFPQEQSGYAPWWRQDVVKTAGAAGDFFRVKKYDPWQAVPGVTLPEATFYDPTRELAASAEAANLGAQGLAAFQNPQAYAAGFSAIQGQSAKNAADIMGRYENLNVGVANQVSSQNAGILNNAEQTRAGLATQLFDKYTIANQQFDNAKNMARQNLRQSYIDAVTNKNNTANLNDLYDQYKIDPSTGGRIRWTNGRPIKPENAEKDFFTQFSDLRQKLPATVTDDAIIKLLSKESSKGATSQGNGIYDDAALRGR